MCANSTETTTGFGKRDESSLWARIQANPRPAFVWTAVSLALVAVEFGAFAGGIIAIADAIIMGITAFFDIFLGLFAPGLAQATVDAQLASTGFLDGLRQAAGELPTLLSRQNIPNQGHQTGPNGPWTGTFLGLAPAYAWALRVVLVFAYGTFAFYWLFRGWTVYRENYRKAKWTPRDNIVNRFRNHRWGQFGVVVIMVFMIMALFAPTLGPSTVEGNIVSPYSHQLEYFSGESGSVETISAGAANFETKSKGSVDQNVGPMTYDKFGRFHPFGTLVNGRDLFTYMVGGARLMLTVVAISMGLAMSLAIGLSMASAYFGGAVDLTINTIADGIVSIPQLLLLILVAVVFANHWLGNILKGGFLLALIFGFTSWPFLWRSVRGPAFQVAQEEWIDAAKSFGQKPRTIMVKHMLPYVIGYLLVYGSMMVGGIIIGLASLSFLGNGLGISPPNPAWGRAISQGQPYVSTPSWHISFIPGVMIVILVMGFNAFGDGLRDAIDPESEGGTDESTTGGVA